MSRIANVQRPARGCYCSDAFPHGCDFCNGYRTLIEFASYDMLHIVTASLVLHGFEEGRDFRKVRGSSIEASRPSTCAEVLNACDAALTSVFFPDGTQIVAEREARFYGERAARWIEVAAELRTDDGYPAASAIDNAARNAARAWHYAEIAAEVRS